MTREQAITCLTNIAQSIFWAEEAIAKEWHEKLKAASSLNKDDQHKLAMAYCEAVAEEIVGKMTDEQLASIPDEKGGEK